MRLWKLKIDKQWQEKTVEQVLRSAGFSHKEISRLKFKSPGILLDGKQCRSTQRVLSGQEITLHLEDKSDSVYADISIKSSNEAVKKTWEILYEDADLLVAEKPSGISCHPGRGHYKENLGIQLQEYCRQQGESCTIRLIGRLDKDTSGLVVYAKNQTSAARLWKQREDNIFQKKYVALVHGCPASEHGTITASIDHVPGQKNQMQITETGKYAKTHYSVKKVFLRSSDQWIECESDNPLAAASLVEFQLETGRTHQIRVHMASIGHPIMGDPVYGKKTLQNDFACMQKK